MQSDSWYVAIGGESHGPFPFAKIRQEAAEGGLSRETLVWCPGMPGWVKAEEVAGLFPAQEEAPPVLPTREVESPPAQESEKPARIVGWLSLLNPKNEAEARDAVKATCSPTESRGILRFRHMFTVRNFKGLNPDSE